MLVKNAIIFDQQAQTIPGQCLWAFPRRRYSGKDRQLLMDERLGVLLQCTTSFLCPYQGETNTRRTNVSARYIACCQMWRRSDADWTMVARRQVEAN